MCCHGCSGCGSSNRGCSCDSSAACQPRHDACIHCSWRSAAELRCSGWWCGATVYGRGCIQWKHSGGCRSGSGAIAAASGSNAVPRRCCCRRRRCCCWWHAQHGPPGATFHWRPPTAHTPAHVTCSFQLCRVCVWWPAAHAHGGIKWSGWALGCGRGEQQRCCSSSGHHCCSTLVVAARCHHASSGGSWLRRPAAAAGERQQQRPEACDS